MNEVTISQSIHIKADAQVVVLDGETSRWVSIRSGFSATSCGIFAADADTAERLADAFGVLARRMRKAAEPAVVAFDADAEPESYEAASAEPVGAA